MIFKNKNIIEFWSEIDGLADIDECIPKPATKFIPEWWKKTEYKDDYQSIKNIKSCPSFPDMFSQGYIIPAWCDMVFVGGENPGFRVPNDRFKLSFHTHKQFLDHVPTSLSKEVSVIIKAHCPWRIKTKRGYSVYQMPLFFHYNRDYSIVPGIIDTDRHHIINQQIMLHTDKKEVFIKRGDPFVWYIPFKREKYKLEVRNQTENDYHLENISKINIFSKFDGGYKMEKYNG